MGKENQDNIALLKRNLEKENQDNIASLEHHYKKVLKRELDEERKCAERANYKNDVKNIIETELLKTQNGDVTAARNSIKDSIQRYRQKLEFQFDYAVFVYHPLWTFKNHCI